MITLRMTQLDPFVLSCPGWESWVPGLTVLDVRGSRHVTRFRLRVRRSTSCCRIRSLMSAADAAGVEELLTASRTFDVMAGWVTYLCQQRGWNALTTDPGRLQRIDPRAPTELLL